MGGEVIRWQSESPVIPVTGGVTDQSKGSGRNSQLGSLYQMFHKQCTATLTFGKHCAHFTNDSISVEVDCPCCLALFLYIQAYLRIYIRLLFTECLLFAESFISISMCIILAIFPFHLHFTKEELEAQRWIDPDQCYRAAKFLISIRSASAWPWPWSLIVNSSGILGECLTVMVPSHYVRLSSSHHEDLLWKLTTALFIWLMRRN